MVSVVYIQEWQSERMLQRSLYAPNATTFLLHHTRYGRLKSNLPPLHCVPFILPPCTWTAFHSKGRYFASNGMEKGSISTPSQRH